MTCVISCAVTRCAWRRLGEWLVTGVEIPAASGAHAGRPGRLPFMAAPLALFSATRAPSRGRLATVIPRVTRFVYLFDIMKVNVEDFGFVVDLGVYRAPNPPRSPFPPR